MINADQRWETTGNVVDFICSVCNKPTRVHGTRVTEYRNGSVYRDVVVCSKCVGDMIKHRFHMSPLRGRSMP